METQLELFSREDDVSAKRNDTQSPRPKRRPKALSGAPDAPWRQGWDLTEEEVAFFRERSVSSAEAKRQALSGKGRPPIHPINVPRLDPAELMPRLSANGLRALSLFSGGGGLDLGFDLAGYEHIASYDILRIAGETLRQNRPNWMAFAGEEEGDVCRQDWAPYKGKVDVLHGGPPCQPFSSAGRQLGKHDRRNMFPEFVRAVLACQPRAFVAENVAALTQPKFKTYLRDAVLDPLSAHYCIDRFELKAEWFGVPQFRVRHFIVGFRSKRYFERFKRPAATHRFLGTGASEDRQEEDGLFGRQADKQQPRETQRTMGVREALGLPDTGYDALAPTLRSGFTGPRGTTSVNSSVAALRAWGELGIWPNGVAVDRRSAHLFVPENGHFRLSIPDCALLQGFPESWTFCGKVWSILGQIGNSVVPPMAYQLALAVAQALP